MNFTTHWNCCVFHCNSMFSGRFTRLNKQIIFWIIFFVWYRLIVHVCFIPFQCAFTEVNVRSVEDFKKPLQQHKLPLAIRTICDCNHRALRIWWIAIEIRVWRFNNPTIQSANKIPSVLVQCLFSLQLSRDRIDRRAMIMINSMLSTCVKQMKHNRNQ